MYKISLYDNRRRIFIFKTINNIRLSRVIMNYKLNTIARIPVLVVCYTNVCVFNVFFYRFNKVCYITSS